MQVSTKLNFKFIMLGWLKMSSKNVKKYYAIKDGKGVKNKIVYTWEECKELVHGYPSIYKSFRTEEEAHNYLGLIKEVDIPKIKNSIKKSIEVSKKKKSTTKAISFRVPNEVYDSFIEKVEANGISMEKILTEMIKEWIE